MLILASQSPSRRHILTELGVPFTVDAPHIDETPQTRETPDWYVQRLALEKAQTVAQRHPDAFVLAGDTTVAVGRRILGKAADEDEVRQQMRLLSGRRHRVYTALCLAAPNHQLYQRLAVAHVAFKVLEPWEIEVFVDSQQWRHVAVYRYEGVAARFLRWMRGCPSTIQGLPAFDAYQMLKGHGLMGPTHPFA